MIDFALRALLLSVLFGLGCCASAEKPETELGKAAMSEDDLANIRALLQKISDAFLAGDATAVGRMVIRAERPKIVETLKREFSEARYLEFQVADILPECPLSADRYSVDAMLRLKLIHIDVNSPSDVRKPVENSTTQNFIVYKLPNNEFRLVDSTLFDNMGRRNGVTRNIVDWIWRLTVLSALLVFWVWMGSDAYFLRPRSKLWRTLIWIPVLGGLFYFFAKFLPSKFKRADLARKK